VVDDIIYYKDRTYLVPESTLKEKIMKAMHDTPFARHPGYFKTYRPIRERFSWKGLVIAQFVLAQKPKASGYKIGITGNNLSLSP
jgi:hypothetical protein